jgi:hypothetical protein
MSARVLSFPAASPFALDRQGSRLSLGQQTWNMVEVHGPLPSQGPTRRQFFRVVTAEEETLIVYRESGEKGMRRLFLFCLGERNEALKEVSE